MLYFRSNPGIVSLRGITEKDPWSKGGWQGRPKSGVGGGTRDVIGGEERRGRETEKPGVADLEHSKPLWWK